MKIKIIFIIDNSVELSSKDPLYNKCISQLSNLKKIEFDTLIYNAEINKFLSIDNCNEKIKIRKNTFNRYFNYIKNKIICDMNMYKLISILDEKNIVYMRYPVPTPILFFSFRKKRRCKIIMEFQSIEFLEFKINHLYILMLFELIFGNSIRNKLDGLVSVTNQIKEYESLKSGDLNIPNIYIGNGVNVDSLKMRSVPSYSGNEMHILCVANINPWHGIDRLLHGILLYAGEVNLVLHIVGDGNISNSFKKISECNDTSKKVIFHGYLTGSKLDNLFDICHISMGSLGMHRIGLQEGTPLKTREYCSRGIPFFISYRDPDFDASFPFMLKIPADDSPANVGEIINFVKKIYTDKKHNEKMRLYALNKLDWSVKMKQLKLFLNDI